MFRTVFRTIFAPSFGYIQSQNRLQRPHYSAFEIPLSSDRRSCVYILPQNEFRRIAAQIQHTSLSNKAARSYLRVFLSGAVDDVPDKQGRVIVPQILRKYAGIEKDVTVIGVGTRAEIWDTAAWEEYLASQEEDYSNMADDVLPEVDF